MAHSEHLDKQSEHARETCGQRERELSLSIYIKIYILGGGGGMDRGAEMGRDLLPNSHI